MSTCPRCQTENPPQAKFCLECAAPLAARCANCGTQLPASAKFCLECARPVSGTPVGPRRFASPETYTPKHLAERILTSKAALEGERKQVTVLFADLKGSMELLADRDPEESRKLLDPVLEHMMEAVHHYEGTVNQVMGDGIMALFGAPLAHEDHAVRACYAALRMQESVKRYAEVARRTAGVPIHIRVGMNSGEVVVRSIGSDLHMDYTAVGQTTHLAARMEQLAKQDAVLITAETLRFAEGYVEVDPLGAVPVKGLAEPIEVYEVKGAGPVRTRLQASAARGFTRFVGRDAEVEQLRAALEQGGRGSGQIVAVVGEPGVGKSRLFHEFISSHRTRGWLTLESASVSYGKATAYLPVLDLLRRYFRIEPRDDTRTIREKVAGKVLMLDRALEDAIPAVLALLDALPEDSTFGALDPPRRRQLTLAAIKRLLLRESQVQPLLVVFEDLHWIDSETQAFLDGLVESLPAAPLLLLVNYRPEYQHAWGSRTYYRQLRIDPLAAESADELLSALLGNDHGLGALKRLLIERTEGNPLFIEECVRTLVETGALTGSRAAYRVAAPLQSIQVPASVQAILAARIDRLAPGDKQLLQTAAVIGKDVPFALLARLAEFDDEALRRGLGHLQGAEFLYETKLFPELEYTFKHALTHEVGYGSLLGERRRALHGRIVEELESLSADRLSEQVEQLAHHAFRAEAWEKAVAYLSQAGERAAARSAYREAVACCEQALAALDRLPESREKREKAIDLRLALRPMLVPLADFDRMAVILREAEAEAQALGDANRLGRVVASLTEALRNTGELDRSRATGERAILMAADLGDALLEFEATFHLGLTLAIRGEYRLAVDRFRRCIELHARLPGEDLRRAHGFSVGARSWLAHSLARLGEFTEAIAVGTEARSIADSADYVFNRMVAYNQLAWIHLMRRELEAATPLFERGLEQARAAEVKLALPSLAAGLGHVRLLAGRRDDGIALLEQAASELDSQQRQWLSGLRVVWLGEGYLLADQIERALERAGHALEIAQQRKERGHEALALSLLGEIVLRRSPPDVKQAEGRYQEALALATELGMRPLVAHCHLGLGGLYRLTGERREAAQHLTTATTMFREMDMGFWLAQSEAEMKKLQ
jgi:class 3 adenylate cyclase/tetratricopeptide (TPR) repeat protein